MYKQLAIDLGRMYEPICIEYSNKRKTMRYENSACIAENQNEQGLFTEKRQSYFQSKNIKLALFYGTLMGLLIGICIIYVEVRLNKCTNTQKNTLTSWRDELTRKYFFANVVVSIQQRKYI